MPRCGFVPILSREKEKRRETRAGELLFIFLPINAPSPLPTTTTRMVDANSRAPITIGQSSFDRTWQKLFFFLAFAHTSRLLFIRARCAIVNARDLSVGLSPPQFRSFRAISFFFLFLLTRKMSFGENQADGGVQIFFYKDKIVWQINTYSGKSIMFLYINGF